MSVRGSKNKIILYIAGVCSIVFVILLYQNASTRLEAMEKSYERCHLNEESLSAQLQVNLEYKVRLEKSLQQVKEDLQSKLEEERQTRERENLEAVNKFTALQQQYKILQSQHEDLNQECGKLRQSHLTEIDEKTRLEILIQNLRDELKLVKESKTSEIEQWKTKYDDLKKENAFLKENKAGDDLKNQENSDGSHIKLPDKLPLNASILKGEEQADTVAKPDAPVSAKSSTSARKAEQELFPSGNNMYVNTSTPMINPDAVNSQDKILSAGPMPQPQKDETQFQREENKENVGAKPESNNKDKEAPNDGALPQGVLRAPDLMKDFAHVPAIQSYKEKLKPEGEKNNNAGEIGDEGEPLMRNMEPIDGKQSLLREVKSPNEVFIRPRVGNEIPKNPVYQYQGDYDNRKEEGEDDDDVDPLEYHNEKNLQQQQQQQQLLQQQIVPLQPLPLQRQQQVHPHIQQMQEERQNGGIHFRMPYQEKRESVMIQPK